MTILEPINRSSAPEEFDPQRFIFRHTDWVFYKNVSENLANRAAFVTYYKGKLEVVTTSLLHEAITGLFVIMIRVLAEEANVSIKGAGAATLERVDLDEGTAPDASFYIAHELQMRGKQTIDLALDPPPDLAIEVEVTRRLGERKSIYRDLNVPEVWVYTASGLTVLIHQKGQYISVDRSPIFPMLTAQELSGFITAGLNQDETLFAKSFRAKVKEAIGPQLR
jgi:Uma2 family endonuclease